MTALKILTLCVTAALICASLRAVHPEIASAVALAAGVAALLLSSADIAELAAAIEGLERMTEIPGVDSVYLLKLCGIALTAEFASDICRDAGEAALARRIDTGVRIGIVVSALPAISGLVEELSGMLK